MYKWIDLSTLLKMKTIWKEYQKKSCFSHHLFAHERYRYDKDISVEDPIHGKIRATPPSGMNNVISLTKAQNSYSVYMVYKISGGLYYLRIP